MRKLTAKKLDVLDVENLVQAKLKWILENAQPVSVWLIGSAARGEMTDASDLDFVLLFNDSSHKKALMSQLYRAPCPVEWPTDLLAYTREEFALSVSKGGGVCWLALREGRLLHGNGES